MSKLAEKDEQIHQGHKAYYKFSDTGWKKSFQSFIASAASSHPVTRSTCDHYSVIAVEAKNKIFLFTGQLVLSHHEIV